MKFIASITEQLSLILGNNFLLEKSFLNNQIKNYLIFFILFVLIFIIFRIFRTAVLKRIKSLIKKTGFKIGDILISMIDTIKTPFYWFVAFYLSLQTLTINPLILKSLTGLLIAWLAYQLIKASQVLIDYGLNKYLAKEKDQSAQQAINFIAKFIKAVLWLIAGLVILSYFGLNITSIVAGLGVGGIAIALALQNILNDLFSSFAIYFDKPFLVGDFIVTGEHSGIVEKIGIKTTRIRALQGEEIVISNKELTSVRIQNFKKMTKRRVVFNFGVVYQTSSEKLKKIPLIIEEIVKKEPLTEIDRVHFAKFNDSSLNFEVVYYILSGVYKDYMDIQQRILFQIKDVFEKEKISMAFPTQTIYLEK
jgi:small-conductance mechanosensitive channel